MRAFSSRRGVTAPMRWLLALLVLLIAPSAQACEFIHEPPGPGLFLLFDPATGNQTTLEVQGRWLGGMCGLSNLNALDKHRFAWLEGGSQSDSGAANVSLHVYDLATKGQRSFSVPVPASDASTQAFALAGDHAIVEWLMGGVDGNGTWMAVFRYDAVNLTTGAISGIRLPSDHGWRGAEGGVGVWLDDSIAYPRTLSFYNLTDGRLNPNIVSLTEVGVPAGWSVALVSPKWIIVQSPSATDGSRAYRTTGGTDGETALSMPWIPTVLDGDQLWAQDWHETGSVLARQDLSHWEGGVSGTLDAPAQLMGASHGLLVLGRYSPPPLQQSAPPDGTLHPDPSLSLPLGLAGIAVAACARVAFTRGPRAP